MDDKKKRKLSATEFMMKHQQELEESEEWQNQKLSASMLPQKVPLTWLMTSSPERDAWLNAREAIPGNRLMRELKGYWRVRLLGAAARENSPEAYRELLEGWLIRLGVEPPEGVFVPRRGPRGAPRKESTEQIYRTWLENGRPGWSELAFDVYRADYTRGDAAQR